MSEASVTVHLKDKPDGYGFIYGELYHGDNRHIVNVLPPASEWAGDMKLDGYEPHESDWVLFLDGDEIARVSRREDIEPKYLNKFLS